MKFIPVDPEEVENIRQGRRGRVSYPLLKGFLETGLFLAEVDTTGIQQNRSALTSSLTAYIRNHNMPIKMFMRNNKIYLMRLDMDQDGNQIEDWAEREAQRHIDNQREEEELTAAMVTRRFDSESKKVTK